jgi:hypothetical protein
MNAEQARLEDQISLDAFTLALIKSPAITPRRHAHPNVSGVFLPSDELGVEVAHDAST